MPERPSAARPRASVSGRVPQRRCASTVGYPGVNRTKPASLDGRQEDVSILGKHAEASQAADHAVRIHALDSLRGVAAFSVMIYHCLLVWPSLYETLGGKGVPFFRTEQDPLAIGLLTVTPPSLLWSGREAVILFFVLSGYVLAQGFLRSPQPYLPFVTRRACRLLLPCIAIALPVALLAELLGPVSQPEVSEWVTGHWNDTVSPRLIASHALLLEEPYGLNSPLWSLHYEWRISLLFPLLVMLAAAGPGMAMAASLACAALAVAEMRLVGSNWLSTLIFVPHFMLGVLLAREGTRLPAQIADMAPRARLGLLTFCYLLLNVRWLVPAPGLVIDLFNAAGAALLIALVLASARAQAGLAWPPLAWIGKVSFSLYLVHVPVILAALHLAPTGLPLWTVLAAAVLLSLLLAWGFFHLAERPSIWLGRTLFGRLGVRRIGRAAA
ncbi:acyltransferase family protein [Roseicella aerolata]|uniref:Acyltransferase n=1 Tax=Roseicella aerolata TaxID=2883479 RepID=A0A9X1LCL1_9PROT|nr:acyltransferase [Roseicella aerolata]MCB4824228.1 acyltransferase [Roseicella aerolata]